MVVTEIDTPMIDIDITSVPMDETNRTGLGEIDSEEAGGIPIEDFLCLSNYSGMGLGHDVRTRSGSIMIAIMILNIEIEEETAAILKEMTSFGVPETAEDHYDSDGDKEWAEVIFGLLIQSSVELVTGDQETE